MFQIKIKLKKVNFLINLNSEQFIFALKIALC